MFCMIAVIFSSTRTPEDDAGYAAMAERMDDLARAQDGFVAVESVRDPATRRGITVSYWRDEASARAWRQVAEHLQAQTQGRERWYSEYSVTVAEVSRTHRFP
ncbi:MAG TPA: antibiotic biosynthesis monooxygenase [Actinobacteria bacterium]|nr:antibiotic biosynthesis monooxygenase [Actinomycetota bacterium]